MSRVHVTSASTILASQRGEKREGADLANHFPLQNPGEFGGTGEGNQATLIEEQALLDFHLGQTEQEQFTQFRLAGR